MSPLVSRLTVTHSDTRRPGGRGRVRCCGFYSDSGFYLCKVKLTCAHTHIRGVRSTSSSSQLRRATDGKPAGSVAPASQAHTKPHSADGEMCRAGAQV